MAKTTDDLDQFEVMLSSTSKKAEEVGRFLIENKDRSIDFFETATLEGKLTTRNVGRFVGNLTSWVAEKVGCDAEENLVEEAHSLYKRQLSMWDVSPSVILHNAKRGGIRWPILLHASTVKGGIKPETYTTEALKMVNALCDFYSGERLLPNITPATQHTPNTWNDLKSSWDELKNTTLIEEEAMQLAQWQAGFLQCDLRN